VVAKPARSSSARGVRYLVDEAALRAFQVPAGRPYLFQSHVEGTGAGYSVFAREGRVLVGFGHRRLAEYPTRGGSSVYRESYDHPGMAAAARRLLEATRWSGFAMFEFKITAAGRPVLIEVNPRVWGSIHQGLAAGVNFFEPLLGPAALRLDREVRTYLSPVVYVALAGYLARGDARPLRSFLAHWRHNRADIPLREAGAWLGSLLRLA
jgi:predicted ATP-grasp superfamily ATP-dependent carboligase